MSSNGNLSDVDLRIKNELSEIYQLINEKFEPSFYPYCDPGIVLSFSEALTCDVPEPDQVLKNMLDRGDKMLVVGHSKTRKTFFITQLAFSLAAQVDFLGIEVPKARKVLLVQYEVQPAHFIRRIRRMSEALNLDASHVENRLLTINARGTRLPFDEIQQIIEREEVEVVLFDPFYKLFEGDESDVESVKEILSIFDRITTQSKCALIYVHHDKKGSTDKTEQRDRGGGTGILARDYDVGLAISEHNNEPDAIVIDILQRNYQPISPITAEWHQDCFHLSGLQPLVKKAGRRQEAFDSDGLAQKACKFLEAGSMECAEFREKIRLELGLTHFQERLLVTRLLSTSKVKQVTGSGRKREPKRFELIKASVQPIETIDDVYF